MPDGVRILTKSDRDSEFSRLVVANTLTGAEDVFARPIDGGVEVFRLTTDGSLVAIRTNQMGRSPIRVYEKESRSKIELPKLPVGQIEPGGCGPTHANWC